MTAATHAQISASIVVVSLDPHEQLLACLQQLRECNMLESSPGASTEVVVVDLSSQAGDELAVAASFPCVSYLPEDAALGFAHACNVGIATARGPRVLLLDPCVNIPGRMLPDLIDHLDSHPSVAAVGPRLMRCASFAAMPPAAVDIDDYVGVASSAADATPAETRESVDWLPATCLLVDRRALNEIGPFHEGILFTFEEIDWCRRAREHGWALHRLADLPVELGEDSYTADFDATTTAAPNRFDPFSRSRRKHFRKHHGRAAAIAVDAVSSAKRLVKTAKAAIGLHR